jgi:dihydrodipicolinate synthase/N-acetylneuraminate lyase
MTTSARPWRGVNVASALPFNEDLSIDHAAFAEHVRFLAAGGCDGVVPNGSLGEYQTLTQEERARVVETAVQAAPAGFGVMPGVAAYGALEARRWAEQARDAGCQTVMLLPPNAYQAAAVGATSVLLLPPNSYRAGREAVVEHYREVAKAGLPIVAYNNPIDTKVDLTPGLLAELFHEGLIVAVKEFTGDVRRAYEIAELAPGLDLLVGADDVLLELGIAGAVGWIAGYPNAFPEATSALYRLVTSGDAADIATALPIYRDLHPLLRWDSRTEFVQSIKLSMDVAGRKGGPCRPPRLPLAPEPAARITADTEAVLAKGYK